MFNTVKLKWQIAWKTGGVVILGAVAVSALALSFVAVGNAVAVGFQMLCELLTCVVAVGV